MVTITTQSNSRKELYNNNTKQFKDVEKEHREKGEKWTASKEHKEDATQNAKENK